MLKITFIYISEQKISFLTNQFSTYLPPLYRLSIKLDSTILFGHFKPFKALNVIKSRIALFSLANSCFYNIYIFAWIGFVDPFVAVPSNKALFHLRLYCQQELLTTQNLHKRCYCIMIFPSESIFKSNKKMQGL